MKTVGKARLFRMFALASVCALAAFWFGNGSRIPAPDDGLVSRHAVLLAFDENVVLEFAFDALRSRADGSVLEIFGAAAGTVRIYSGEDYRIVGAGAPAVLYAGRCPVCGGFVAHISMDIMYDDGRGAAGDGVVREMRVLRIDLAGAAA